MTSKQEGFRPSKPIEMEIAKEVADKYGVGGSFSEALMEANRRVPVEARFNMARLLSLQFSRLESEDETKRLYAHLKSTGRSGVILDEDESGDCVVGESNIKKGTGPDSSKNYIDVVMDGVTVGTYEETVDGEGLYTHKVFKPAEGVKVFFSEEIEVEMDKAEERDNPKPRVAQEPFDASKLPVDFLRRAREDQDR